MDKDPQNTNNRINDERDINFQLNSTVEMQCGYNNLAESTLYHLARLELGLTNNSPVKTISIDYNKFNPSPYTIRHDDWANGSGSPKDASNVTLINLCDIKKESTVDCATPMIVRHIPDLPTHPADTIEFDNLYIEAKDVLLNDTMAIADRYDAIFQTFQIATLDDSTTVKFSELKSMYSSIASDTSQPTVLRSKAQLLKGSIYDYENDTANARIAYQQVLNFGSVVQDSLIAAWCIQSLQTRILDTLENDTAHCKAIGDLHERIFIDMLGNSTGEVPFAKSPFVEEKRGGQYATSIHTIQPHPITGDYSIQYSVDHSQFITVKLCNSFGSELQILSSKFTSKGNHILEVINSQLLSGIYFIQLCSDDNIITKPVIFIK